MFAEELGGSVNRRRQEEAKKRRQQLKQQQQKKDLSQQGKVALAQVPKLENNGTLPAFVPTAATPTMAPAVASTNHAPVAIAADSKPTAVANALHQRQMREEAKLQRKAILTIQSFYRTHQSNCSLFTRQSTLLQQRLNDLGTLRNLLKAKTNVDYIPPPATSTALCQQLLFLTRWIPYKVRDGTPQIMRLRDPINDASKVQQVIDFLLLPGICSTDENSNPFLVWMQSTGGLLRLENVLKLCLVSATMPNIDDKVLGSITKFLRAALVDTQDSVVLPSIVQKCRSLLLHSSPPTVPDETSPKKIKYHPHAKKGSALDLLAILRHHLLYFTGGPDPIPAASEKAREACIPVKHRAQADALFHLTLDVLLLTRNQQQRDPLLARFLSEILTIPLLTWKTSASSISKLLGEETRSKTILLIALIEAAVKLYGPILSAGKVDSILASDTSLIVCPATQSQCLLANLFQIARASPKLNGSDVSLMDYKSAVLLFQFLALLCDVVPLGTFLSRESVVEWISDGKGHHSPVVLSPVVMEQCKLLLVDAFLRKIFQCAIDEEALKTEKILNTKIDKDMKHEMDLQEAGQSAATLAAKEARVDRSRSFWNSSAWGRKLTKGVSKILSGDSKQTSKPSAEAKLINTSSVSRTLAESGFKGNNGSKISHTANEKSIVSRQSYTPELLIALCRLYGIILARWGGGGKEDLIKRDGPIMKKDDKGAKQEIATGTPDPCTQTLLNVLCFSTSFVRASWGLIQSDSVVVSDLYALIDPQKGHIPVRALTIYPSFEARDRRSVGDGAALLYVFICALSHVLIVTDDTEIHDMDRPIPLHQLRRCIQTLKKLLYRSLCVDDTSVDEEGELFRKSKGASNYFGLALVSAAARAMKDLYDRSSRRPFCVPKLWLVEDLMEKEIRRCKTHDHYVALLSEPVLRVCPFLVSFKRRLKLFERIVTTNRVQIQGENSTNPFNTNPLKPGIPVRITRGRILEDGLLTMNNLGRNMRQRIAVQYQNEAGTRESGVDAGGLFKEFWTDLSAIAFDPNYALFCVTEGKSKSIKFAHYLPPYF